MRKSRISALTAFIRPLRAFGRHLGEASSRLSSDSSGSVAIYVMLVSTILIGAGALAIDVGRLGSVRAQMQNAADAAALAGAMELDGTTDAIARATAIATNAATNKSLFQSVAGTPEIVVQSVVFYSEYDTSTSPVTSTVTTDDLDAWFIQVTVVPRQINLLLEPAIAAGTGGTATGTITVNAMAVATLDVIICNAPPLMMCDPMENTPPIDLTLESNAGRQMVIKGGPGGVPSAPGQFGLLCPTAGCGANNVKDALADPDPDSCLDAEVTTQPGVATVSVINAVNTRFADGTIKPYYSAPNVINMPQATDINTTDTFFNNDWDRTTYWTGPPHYNASVPTALTNATRYQTYLYELGEDFESSTGTSGGGFTYYPPDGSGTLISPPGTDIAVSLSMSDRHDQDLDGEPTAAQSNPVTDPERRIVKAVLLPCIALGVAGNGTYDSHGKVVELFITELMAPPSDPDFPGALLAESNRILTHRTSSEIYANARLVQ